jgi:FtsP/CotA-like multicopper oxidase with cupredoxin domain
MNTQPAMPTDDRFPTDITGLPRALPTQIVPLGDGDRFELRIAPVVKRIGDATVRMLAYNGSIPGPTLRVRQGSRISIEAMNDGDLDDTVHWHGLRLDNRSDGTHLTQSAIPVGGSFTYHLEFPDPGVYWYHPHVREDYGQDMGLYGNIVVDPTDADYWPPVDREVVLTLDDISIEDGRAEPFSRSTTTHAAMGRYGNVMLVGGEEAMALSVRRGEVTRFYLTCTANARVFNVGFPGGKMKLVGGDSGRYERERFVDSVVVAPSERVVVDVLFDRVGHHALEHRTPKGTVTLGTVHVEGEAGEPRDGAFATLRTAPELTAERESLKAYVDAPPDKTVKLVAVLDASAPEPSPGTELVYVCPMDADVVSTEPGRCPKCGMKLLPQGASGTSHDPSAHGEAPMHHGQGGHHGGHVHADDGSGHLSGIEWEDEMVESNRRTTSENTRWKLIDGATGAEGGAIDWRFRVGDRIKIRVVNEMDSDHPMQHPFHIHGAGRFLVLARDGEIEDNLVWKDTVLVRTGQTVDLLLDVTHPGVWMAHCHIAEHHESGMMLHFRVDA